MLEVNFDTKHGDVHGMLALAMIVLDHLIKLIDTTTS
jgi:hypothetical protein